MSEVQYSSTTHNIKQEKCQFPEKVSFKEKKKKQFPMV